ncbi:right-handed parallel beta-helix repeat-containing protein [Pontixanthobacter aquaemixtae]|uniref:Right-handed parallel beta-helix repeat-containing protein n=1 Tax=Pontixanthobacter aquaemixtae TaxID=1958940 RepID=A0A844ZWH4_9SPHN|nr:right-handed parallel beta-helix repeat-containing protein [Pontixanthobacter aquaemixtae]MXO91602.1 right-handed parallel beta-helix repeat-containing protein [Pontixanthobacter aquaemixtae]
MKNHAHARPSPKITALAAAFAVATIPASAPFAQSGSAFTVVESGRGFDRLQDAVNSIGNGNGTIAVAAGTHRQCAVQEGGSISYMAAVPGKAIFDGVTCEGKAALVLRGRSANVSGLVFRRMAVPDFNGAGIRLEQGNLTVAQSWFLDSQQGILSANDANGQIVIDKSTFSGLGTCEGGGGCAHSIYIGDYGHLRITRSRFERGTGGHYVKARATRVDVASSSFDDSAGRGTNYMIDLPAGSVGQITNNWFVQGQNKENYSAFIAVGAEGRLHTSNGLQIAGNDARLAASVRRNTTFVADWSGDQLSIMDNNLGQGLKNFERR